MKKAGRARALSKLLFGMVLLLHAGCAGVQEKSPAFLDTAERKCLKEGELCSTLNDECCLGYRCYIGLEPRCVRNPAN